MRPRNTMRTYGCLGVITIVIMLAIAPAASAYSFSTYWNNVSGGACSLSADGGSVGSGGTRRKGNTAKNRFYSHIVAAGGYWKFGFYYYDGTRAWSSHSQTGSFTAWDANSYPSSYSDPFIQNMNALTVTAAGCYEYS